MILIAQTRKELHMKNVLLAALRENAQSSRIDIVFDRLNRRQDLGIQYKNIIGGQMVRQDVIKLQRTPVRRCLI